MGIFVYVIMLIGNGIMLLTVVKPAIGEDNQSTMLIEYLCYLFFWLMMVFSHVSTMCADPGFIPRRYEYKEEVIAAPFNTLKEIESAYTSNDVTRSSQKNQVHDDDEEDIRPANDSTKKFSINTKMLSPEKSRSIVVEKLQ